MKLVMSSCLAISLACLLMPAHAEFKKSPNGVLEPNQFKGEVKESYEAAEKNPAVAEKIFCYCGCDKEAKHKNLLDCFRSDHGTYCSTCQGEMMRSSQYSQQGLPIVQIRQKIDSEFSSRYPYPEPSAALKSYRASAGVMSH